MECNFGLTLGRGVAVYFGKPTMAPKTQANYVFPSPYTFYVWLTFVLIRPSITGTKRTRHSTEWKRAFDDLQFALESEKSGIFARGNGSLEVVKSP
jgi:hypothetical protein